MPRLLADQFLRRLDAELPAQLSDVGVAHQAIMEILKSVDVLLKNPQPELSLEAGRRLCCVCRGMSRKRLGTRLPAQVQP
jgi:hypothetical protein